jgi:hypothetical protein
MATANVGGSTDSDINAVAVIPRGPCGVPAATTQTVDASPRMAAR